MTAAGDPLLMALAEPGRRASKLASVICALVVDGAELGALDECPRLGADGAPLLDDAGQARSFKVLPREWLDRLAMALDVGAFDRLSVRQIVDRILAPPLPGSGG